MEKSLSYCLEWLEKIGAKKLLHSNRNLYDHLVGTCKVLQGQNHSNYICLAGLFHSIYGTEFYKEASKLKIDREDIKALIGKDAEKLVFLFSLIKRSELRKFELLEVFNNQSFLIETIHKNKLVKISKKTCDELLVIAYANDIEQNINPNKIIEGSLKEPLNKFFKIKYETFTEISDKDEKVLFLGLPCELGSRKEGSKNGPKVIRDASHKFLFRSKTIDGIININSDYGIHKSVFDIGDLIMPTMTHIGVLNEVENIVRKISNKHTLFSIGGDHSLTLGIIRGIQQRIPKRIKKFIYFDQHLDIQLWGKFTESKPKELTLVSHSNFISYLIYEFPEIKVHQVGANSSISFADENNRKDVVSYIGKNLNIITNNEFQLRDEIYLNSQLPINEDVYLSIDLDVFHSKYISSVSYPSSLGVDYFKCLEILRHIIVNNNIIGIDIMEFSPNSKQSESHDGFVIVNLIFELLRVMTNKINSSNRTA